jgi:hypothetical protein
MPLAFLTGIVVSLLSRERRAEELYDVAERQIHLGAPEPAAPLRPGRALPARSK